MRTKTLISFVAVLLVTLACSSAAFPAPEPTAAATSTPDPTVKESISQSVTLTSIPFSEKSQSPSYKITAQIPSLSGSDDPRVQAFNTELKDLVQKEIDAFKKDTLQNVSTPALSGGSFFDVQYGLVGQKGYFWSLKLNIEWYMDGAAHPGHNSISVNFDLDKGKDVALDEIFLPNSDYLQFISQYCVAELGKRDIGFDSFQQGADPTLENYRVWNISKDGLVITFNEYQVAPYAAGLQTVVIPFSELGKLINNEGPIALFLP